MEALITFWQVLDGLAWVALLGYAAYLALSAYGYIRLRMHHATWQTAPQPPLTVIIPARNEEATLAACLDAVLAQEYPHFEVIVVDDASEDATLRIARQYVDKDLRVTVLKGYGGKKAALTRGIDAAITPWVVTLDADCTPPVTWLHNLSKAMAPDVAMVCAPVTLTGGGMLGDWQALESAGLMVLSAGAFGVGMPGMNNGGNLAIYKPKFEAVGGYAGTTHLASGDDMLLLQKFYDASYRLHYIALPGAVVPTQACLTLRELLTQRRRWLSKTRAYRNPLLLLGSGSLFLFCLCCVLLIPGAILGYNWFPTLGMLCVLKAAIELPVLLAGVLLVRRPQLLLWYPVVALLQLPYVIWAGITSVRPGSYMWKGRVVR